MPRIAVLMFVIGLATGSPLAPHAARTVSATPVGARSAAVAASATATAPIAVRGTDGALWVDAGTGWQSLGGRLGSAPAWATPIAAGTLYVVTGADHALWIRSASQPWQHLANGQETCLDTPAIGVNGSTLTAACAGVDHALWYTQATISGTVLPQAGAWSSLGGYLTAGPGVATVAGQTTFAATGADHSLWFRTAAAPYASTPWSCIGHPALSDDTGGQAYFACHGTDGAAWYARNAGGGWSSAASAGGRLLGGVSLTASPGGADLHVEGTEHQVFTARIAVDGTAAPYVFTGGNVEEGGVGGVSAFATAPGTTPFPEGDALSNPACQVPAGTLAAQGKMIVISIACQVMTAYQDGHAVISSFTTTGRPARPTPRGHFSVVKKNHPWRMVSGDSYYSPYWYPPSWVQYVVWFTFQGHGIHDASWEPNSALGPGSQYDQVMASHGCVHINSDVVASLYNFADLGTPVWVF